MIKKKKNTYHHGDLRAALLETTAKTIVEKGIHNVSMRAVSKEIGVSRTAPYRHFADRAALLTAVAEHGFKMMREALADAAAAAGGTALDRFEAVALAYVEFALGNRAYYQLMFGKEMASDAPPEELLEAANAVLGDAMGIIASCQQEGRFREADPYQLARVAWSTLHGLSSLIIDGQIRLRDKGEGSSTDLPDTPSSAAAKRLAKLAVETLVAGWR